MTGPTGRDPEDSESMAELRAVIDALDDDLLDLFARRARCIDRAVTLKAREGLPPRTTDRVASVLGRVRAGAEARGLDPDLAEAIWSQLIEWGIAREARAMGVRPDGRM